MIFNGASRLHLSEPDYTRPLLEVPEATKQRIIEKLADIYGKREAKANYNELERVMRVYYAHKSDEMIEADRTFNPADRFTEKDIILITYGDIFVNPGMSPLKVLTYILNVYARYANTVHILPFFPYSSDRGFSIIDYFEVDHKIGTWHDIEMLSTKFNLMFDGVINHVSSKSRWFQEFLNGNQYFRNFFIKFSTKDAISDDHLKLILRPRTSDLLTRYNTINGAKYLWTTFSPDQIDLNYKNVKVLLRVVEVLLHYVRRGASLIRLDAVTYLWTKLGTSCAHLEQTHTLIQLFRLILDVVAPRVALVTETNVPHDVNISYFGSGANEAQMVYNFALPPLVLHTFHTGNCRKLSDWASRLERVSETSTYFNFLDSHDGIGLMPVQGILSGEEIDAMIQKVQDHGGIISYRRKRDGSRTPYEMNITWFSALNKEELNEPQDLEVDRFIASRSIPLILMGVPGNYILSMIGSPNDLDAVTKTGEARSINRTVVDTDAFISLLNDPGSVASKISHKMILMMEKRTHSAAFHPNGAQRILMIHDGVFVVVRQSPDKSELVLAITNVTDQKQEITVTSDDLEQWSNIWKEHLTGNILVTDDHRLKISLSPYKILWLTPESSS